MVREHYVIMLLVNHVSIFYMRLCVSSGSHVKYTYMIGQEHSHVVFPDHAKLSHHNEDMQ